MEGKMNSDNILINEYNALLNLRERSIKSVEGSANSYFTFLGLLATAFSFSLKKISDYKVLVIILGLGVILYGRWIYRSSISSLINFTIYTRQLNLTRKALVKNKSSLKNKIFLPIDGEKPEFDGLGFFGEKFSKNGFLAVLKWINSILLGLLIYFFFDNCSLLTSLKGTIDPRKLYFNLGFFIFSFIGFICFFCLHDHHHTKMMCKAEKKWKCERIPKFK